MKGKIIANIRGTYTIFADGINYNVFSRGHLRHQNKNLLVGDEVIFDEELLTIEDLLPRKNELIRPKSSNIDEVLIAMSLKEPDYSLELIYKFLTYANMNNIPASVILTKADLVDDFAPINKLIDDLEKVGVKTFVINPNDQIPLDCLRDYLSNKTTIIMGQTGVGKSTLMNEIDPSFNRLIGEYSLALNRGKHKTKEVVLCPYKDGFIGDTPGFSSLELGIFKEDLATYFPGYNSLYTECYFSDCLHQNEKDCKIKEEMEKGHLSKDAYEVYLKLLNELPYRKERFKK